MPIIEIIVARIFQTNDEPCNDVFNSIDFFLFLLTAQAMISPSIGKLMDYLAHNHFDGKPNYLIPFIGHDVFLILCIINVFCIKLEVDLPKSSGMKGLKKIFGNLDICFFLAVMFVLGKEICLKKV